MLNGLACNNKNSTGYNKCSAIVRLCSDPFDSSEPRKSESDSELEASRIDDDQARESKSTCLKALGTTTSYFF